jgi:hypothetical protein
VDKRATMRQQGRLTTAIARRMGHKIKSLLNFRWQTTHRECRIHRRKPPEQWCRKGRMVHS